MITKLNFTDRTIKSYAIRKLTPKECFRLMGVRDNVIGTMQSSNAQAAERLPDWKGKGKPEDMAISASQQYKQAGNSIVVDVLAHIYEQLFYPRSTQASPRQAAHSLRRPRRYPARPAAHRRQERREDIPHHVLRLRLAAHGSRRATRVASRLSMDMRRMERHRQIRLSDAQSRLPSVCRLRPW